MLAVYQAPCCIMHRHRARPARSVPGSGRAEAVLVNAGGSAIAKQRAGAQQVGPLGPHLELRQLRRRAAARWWRLLVGRSHRLLGLASEVQAAQQRGSDRLLACGDGALAG